MMIRINNKAFGTVWLPDKKEPCLIISDNSECIVVGTLIDEKSADMFMNFVSKMIGAKEGDDEGRNHEET